jgi:hypothetical protein
MNMRSILCDKICLTLALSFLGCALILEFRLNCGGDLVAVKPDLPCTVIASMRYPAVLRELVLDDHSSQLDLDPPQELSVVLALDEPFPTSGLPCGLDRLHVGFVQVAKHGNAKLQHWCKVVRPN